MPTAPGTPRSRTGRKKRSPEEIRSLVLEAAREEFKLNGFGGATTAAISRRAKVAEIQMFRYFASKAELFREAIFAPLTKHFQAFNEQHIPKAVDVAGRREQALQYTAELQAFLSEHVRAIVSLYFMQTYGPAAQTAAEVGLDGLQRFFDDGAALMHSRAPGKSEMDPAIMFRVAFGALLGCITYKDWLFPGSTRDDAAIDKAIGLFILAGIAPHSDLGAAK